PNIILITRRCYVDEWLPSCDAASARIGQVGRLGFWHYLAVGIVPAVMSLAITFGCIALTWRSTLRTEVMDGPIAAPSFDHRKLEFAAPPSWRSSFCLRLHFHARCRRFSLPPCSLSVVLCPVDSSWMRSTYPSSSCLPHCLL